MASGSTGSIDRPSLLAAAVILALASCLAAWFPITAPEAYSFSHFVRPPLRDLLGAFDPAESVLSLLIVKRAVGLLRLSTFSLRIPDLAGLALWLWAAAKFSRRRWPWVLLAGAAYLALEFRFVGTGVGLGLALWVCGFQRAIAYLQLNQPDELRNLNQSGMCLGLSVAAHLVFLLPSLILAAAIGIAAHSRKALPYLDWLDRMLVTAAVTAFLFLVLPFSHATGRGLLAAMTPTPVSTGRSPREMAALVRALELQARGQPARIAAPPDLVPVIEFYRDRDRDGAWRILASPAQADYSVVDTNRNAPPAHLLYSGRTLSLAP